MDIVKGRGNKRSVFVFPCAHYVRKSPKEEQEAGLNFLCSLVLIEKVKPKEGATV